MLNKFVKIHVENENIITIVALSKLLLEISTSPSVTVISSKYKIHEYLNQKLKNKKIKKNSNDDNFLLIINT